MVELVHSSSIEVVATDVLWTCSSAEIYELLVLQRGWSHHRFAHFLSDIMIGSLLSEPH